MSQLPDYPEALAEVIDLATFRTARETMALTAACGRVLAQEIIADRDLPPFNRAMMDGYALRVDDLKPGEPMDVAGDIPAGAPADIDVPIGACVKIATGAPVPEALDTVIQHELSDRQSPVTFSRESGPSIARGNAIHPRGADTRKGQVVVTPGALLLPHLIGIAATVGCAQIATYARPMVAIFTSGDEVRRAADSVADHQIRNSNGPMLVEALKRFGADVRACEHIRDDRQATIDALRAALDDGGCDIAITVGGVSAGERDHFPAAYKALGFVMSLHGARIQPGKPICAGSRDEQIVIGLPGNPVSALVCAHLFIRPLVNALQNAATGLPWRRVRLAESVKPNAKRQAFRPARLLEQDSVLVPAWAGSGDLVHTASTHGVVALPVQQEPVEAGTMLSFLPWA